jgi:hypothetical protein
MSEPIDAPSPSVPGPWSAPGSFGLPNVEQPQFRSKERMAPATDAPDPSPQTTPPMTPADFLAALERHLQLHGVPFDRRSLRAFVESAWPLIEEDPTPSRWCSEFLAACQAGAVE